MARALGGNADVDGLPELRMTRGKLLHARCGNARGNARHTGLSGHASKVDSLALLKQEPHEQRGDVLRGGIGRRNETPDAPPEAPSARKAHERQLVHDLTPIPHDLPTATPSGLGA